jgi:6-phosphofructokinase 1
MAGELLASRHYNVMVGVKGDTCVPVPLRSVAGVVRRIPDDHAWLRAAVQVGTCLGVHGAE